MGMGISSARDKSPYAIVGTEGGDTMSRLTYTADMAEDRTDTHPGPIQEHWCEHPECNEWGGFGYSSGRSSTPRWWCWEHYPYKEPGSTRANGAA